MGNSARCSALAAVIVVLLCPLVTRGQSDQRPLSAQEVIRAVELGVSTEALIKQIESRGINFRITDFQVDQLNQLLESKDATVAQNVTFALAKAQYTPPVNPWLGLHLKNQSNGVFVRFVFPDTPAQAADIRVGDRILTVDGQPVQDSEVLVTLVQAGRIGQASSIELIRDSQPLKLDVKLAQQPDDESMHQTLRTCAEGGNVEAQFILATNLFFGIGVDKDVEQAVAWTKKAAEAGSAEAQASLGEFMMQGIGIDKDMPQAVAWLRKSAEQNHPVGQRILALALMRGDGTPTDNNEARKFALLAAGQGDVVACRILGWMSDSGTGVTADRDQAIKWYRQAAKQGDQISAKELERMEADKMPHP